MARFHITISDEDGEKITRWANKEGRPTANLASYLITTAIADADKKGLIPPPQNMGKDKIPIQISELFAKLVDGGKLNAEEEDVLAEVAGRNAAAIHNASLRIREGGSPGKGAKTKRQKNPPTT